MENKICENIKIGDIIIKDNYITDESMKIALKTSDKSKILYIGAGDDPKDNIFYGQGYNLEETIKIRNYLNNLIDKTIAMITN